MDIEEMFSAAGENEFLKFDRIPESGRRHVRPDICAFIYLHEKVGGTWKIIAGAEHDEIYLDGNGGEGKLTEEDVVYLTRCGVRYGESGLCMFA